MPIPGRTYPVQLGGKTYDLSLADIICDSRKGNFPHHKTMTCQLVAADKAVDELECYSVDGGFIEWKGYTPPRSGLPLWVQRRAHAEAANPAGRAGYAARQSCSVAG